MELLFLVGSLLALGVAANMWGTDSRYGIDDPEWERRRDWPTHNHMK